MITKSSKAKLEGLEANYVSVDKAKNGSRSDGVTIESCLTAYGRDEKVSGSD